MTVELACVRDAGKLRVRIVAYITGGGERYEGVYNNSFNCRFPRDARVEGRLYRVPDGNVKLLGGGRVARYYSVKTANMVTLQRAAVERIWNVSRECAICMDSPSCVVFAPCGHFCSCEGCSETLRTCCVCRAPILEVHLAS